MSNEELYQRSLEINDLLKESEDSEDKNSKVEIKKLRKEVKRLNQKMEEKDNIIERIQQTQNVNSPIDYEELQNASKEELLKIIKSQEIRIGILMGQLVANEIKKNCQDPGKM